MKQVWTMLFLFSSFIASAQWTEIQSLGDKRVLDFNFLNDDLGYVLVENETRREGGILKTTDGGLSWTDIEIPNAGIEWLDIHFYEEGKGVYSVRNMSDATVPCKIFITLDDGQTWKNISPPSTPPGNAIGHSHFFNDQTGYFAVERKVFKTIDGGETWTESVFNERIVSMDWLDEDQGLVGIWNERFSYKGGMYVTLDGGQTWIQNLLDDNYTSIVEVEMLSEEFYVAAPVFGWAAAAADRYYTSTDYGSTWEENMISVLGDKYSLRQIEFSDPENGVIAVGNFSIIEIYSTDDGGITWIKEGEYDSVYDSHLQLTPNNGYIGGKIGSIYKRQSSNSNVDLEAKSELDVFPTIMNEGDIVSWNSQLVVNRIRVIDQMGKTIFRMDGDSYFGEIQLAKSGLFFVNFEFEEGELTRKVVVSGD